MNLNSAALLLMAAKGLSLEDVAEIVKANEEKRDPTAAERQARCRARKKSRRDVTRDPPNDIILTPEDTPTSNDVGPKPVTKSRGTRLPSDWVLPDEWREWAKGRRNWRDGDISEEAEIFANYWQAKSGAGACHTDWFKTWRNWVIRSHRADGSVQRTFSPAEEIAQLESMIPNYEKLGRRDYVEQAKARIAELRGERTKRPTQIGQLVTSITRAA